MLCTNDVLVPMRKGKTYFPLELRLSTHPTVQPWPGPWHSRPFKKNEVLIFGAALGFSHYLVHLMPIGTILSEIDQYLDLPHRLWSFRVLVHTLTLAGMGDYILGWSCLYNFLKTPGFNLLSDAVLNADHDKIIKINIFQNIGGGEPPALWVQW